MAADAYNMRVFFSLFTGSIRSLKSFFYSTKLQWLLTGLSLTGVLLVLCGLIYGDYAAFTWEKFTLTDYGKYVNTIWNCGHGHWYKFMVHQNYLGTHLSYSLALLGPFLLIWDHPFFISILQWLGLVLGSWILWRSARRHGLNYSFSSALVFLYAAYPYTQSVMLSEFHGVSFYYLLIPWLYHFLSFHKKWVGIPYLITLGLREDAPFIIIPVLLYFAVKDRWNTGYAYALFALIFGLIGLGVVFPCLSGCSLIERRPDLGKMTSFTQRMGIDCLLMRGNALFWLFLPVLPFLKKGWKIVLFFPLTGLIQTMITPYPSQYSLFYHYSAPVFTCLILGILEAVSRDREGLNNSFIKMVVPLYLLLCVLFANHVKGFLYGGGSYAFVYGTINKNIYRIDQALKAIPSGGVLLCSNNLAGFCSNRENLLSWEYWNADKGVSIDYFFLTRKDVVKHKDILLPLLKKNEYTLLYSDERQIILGRGIPLQEQREALIVRLFGSEGRATSP
jgi:uncharacterized membrane protein